ncbi:Dynamin-like GTPase that mediates homotypic ER fusion [Puccinia graminis f. sp. tritici]|uniref:Dynamin-like GTPase that mediates homotypic ER fusion n=2 Tax=Puccinia graminis f. sp. tritici TaxID=56615 RepID=A0A5B0RQY5_PUCGR|nr:Dynamin-like GTPase that mediates homotypic ER fusion [Puccinia graminis f. sp. tritici]KAA1127445.1 Dynamin-like GTPase that mediates homotypic ER fusion [Puccinia graminis f. sp. tritici]
MMAEPLQNTNGYRHHTEQVQVIGEEQRFTDVLPKSIESWGLLEKGFNYDVVAVFGSQSTGKSTLLNRVFGTTFDVMNEAERRQTTKGIWMCKGKDMDVLVMDVEGADGRERGEDQDFERKAALFSMASSEVIIVNMWEHQVGLYQGANMGLLRTVFEVDLALFQANKAKQRTSTAGYDKTHLLFVIRDHVGSTPLSNLENTITTDLNRIWDTLVKPEGTESSKITDYFDLTFTALSHKILQPENFDREVENFRRRFVDKTHPDYVFKPIYHKRIPADGLAQYMSGIWDAVVSNKDLDLPTQQELLAQFRCDEIAATSFEQFTTLIQPLKTKMESGKLVDELGTKMLEARRTCLASFDLAASRYHTGVYQRKRTEFMTKMNSNLSPLFLAQLKILSKSIIKRFQAELIHELKTGSGVRDFKEVVSSQMQASQKEFEDGVKLVLLDETDWMYTEELNQLVEDLTNISNQCKVDEMKKLLSSIEKEMKRETNEVVELAMTQQKIEMWDAVLRGFQEALDRAKTKYHDKSASFSCTEEDDQRTKEILSRKGWISLRNKIDEQTVDATLLVKLKLAFEEKFRYDAAGVPKVWKPEDDIDGAFRTAREATLALIPIYAAIQPAEKSLESCIPTNSGFESDDLDLAEYDFDGSRLILSGIKQTELSNRLKKESDAYYLEAKRSLVSSISQIPYWMYAVIAILGWNEFLAVLKSPVYFATILILAFGVWVTFKLNMQGPIVAIGTGLYHETSKVAQEKLKEYLSEVPSGQNRSGFTNSTTDTDEVYHLKKRNSRAKLSSSSNDAVEEIPLQEFK